MAQARSWNPGEFRVCEIGDIALMDGSTIHGAIVEFPAGPPSGMTWGNIWDGTAFTVAKVVTEDQPSE